MKPNQIDQLLQFLREELNLPEDSIDLATRQSEATHQLPVVLWQYGLVDLQQLARIWDWEMR
ncbi:MAG: DUF2949 domain-containing protein [Cyanobacteria bacterium SID2]|nr:DUF2949 domain-containing protein [Cyanobacteria bacterium SID2]MBP0004294.1 DUF2949 domain-containing protein [Cyanobacteria bacterium SBC]